ncbi:hypothetical protein FRB97_003438 [Tulasnella sp. 331]|nr:hypothetical protein FRB97_003438 [Tulasnella sp. 331]KAG8884166.1 hypothetical protein FRB98_002582 [Tulasnella sp. 332]
MSATSAPHFIGAVKDEWLMYSDNPEDYTRLSPIGFGASSIVYQAVHHYKDATGKVKDLPCALKVLNLDKLQPSALRLLTRETQLMSLSKAVKLKSPAPPIVAVEEEVVKCVLHQALQGLNYLHVNGFVHRDIKGANLLIDDDGTVLLGDLGVAVSLADEEDTGQNSTMSAVRKGMHSGLGGAGGGPLVFGASAEMSPVAHSASKTDKAGRIGKRRSFVGTPSWMAPEVITQQHYDYSADIWSLGITVLEMCTGSAPGSREKDVKKVLMATLQNVPPTLDRASGDRKYSKDLKELVDSCLQKDPSRRPTAAQLLQHPVFKGVKKKSYLVNTLLVGLPPLASRQERRLVNQPQSKKPHPLALGSPSVTSVHGHSWDWAFSDPGSPRSTAYRPVSGLHQRDDSDPLSGLILNPSADPLHSHGLEYSPSGSMHSLHHPPAVVTGVASRVNGDLLGESVDEADDEEGQNDTEAALQRPGRPGTSISQNGGGEDYVVTPGTPQIHPKDLTTDVSTLEGGDEQELEPLAFQPPELSSSFASSTPTTNSPETPPASTPPQAAPISQPKFKEKLPNPAAVPPSGKSGGLWKKMKGIALSSKKDEDGGGGIPSAGERDQGIGLGSSTSRGPIARTVSKGAGGTSKRAK